MKLRFQLTCVVATTLCALAALPHAVAQEKRMPRIGIIPYTNADLAHPLLRHFERDFAQRGWVEGRTATIV